MAEKSLTETETLKARIAELEGIQKKTGEDEALILKKMSAGISREQAVASIKNQRAFDAKQKEVAEEAKKAAKK